MSDKENPAIAVLQARMEEQMKTIFNLMNEVRTTQNELVISMTKMDGRMQNVEQALEKAQPTLDSYIEVKHKIEGAGKAGTVIWSCAAAVLGAIVFFKQSIVDWLTR